MISKTRKKEIMKYRNAELKELLIETESNLSDADNAVASEKSMMNHQVTKLEDDVKSLENKLSLEVNRLTEIRNAIETVAAVKFPGVGFNEANHTPFMTQMPDKAAEPDELLVLRHLYRLTGW